MEEKEPKQTTEQIENKKIETEANEKDIKTDIELPNEDREYLNIKVKKLDEKAVIPTYAYDGDAGFDFTATDVVYDPVEDSYTIHTGLAFEFPKGYGMFLYPRSSNKRTNAYMTNHVGVVDCQYRGEVKTVFKNRDIGIQTPPYLAGERFMQGVVKRIPTISFIEVDELTPSDRGSNGYGSTGK